MYVSAILNLNYSSQEQLVSEMSLSHCQFSHTVGKDRSNLVFIYIYDFGTKWGLGGRGMAKDHLLQKCSAHMVTVMCSIV